MLQSTGAKIAKSENKFLTTVAWQIGGATEYALEGSVFIGGATGNDALLQFQADILQIPVVRPQTAETSELGAAYRAGLAVGFWQSKDELKAHRRPDKIFVLQMSGESAVALLAKWKRAVECAINWSS